MSAGPDAPGLDPRPVFAALYRHGAWYVVVGGLAAQLHGSTQPTRGIDITPDRSPANLARVAAALAEVGAREWAPGFGYPLQVPMDSRRLDGTRVLLTHTQHGRVDVVPVPHGLPRGYDQLSERARDITAYGQRLRVADIDDLLRSRAARRVQDLVSLSQLVAVKRTSDERGALAPYEVPAPPARPAPYSAVSVHDALIASERLATVFDDIRPALAYVRRELYRAVDTAMYGDEQRARTSIARAQHAASRTQADILRLRRDLEPGVCGPGLFNPPAHRGEDTGGIANLAHLAGEEVAVGLRLLGTVAAQRQLGGHDETRDLLIEARLHIATADNHMDLLQIQLERSARSWQREVPRDRGYGRE